MVDVRRAFGAVASDVKRAFRAVASVVEDAVENAPAGVTGGGFTLLYGSIFTAQTLFPNFIGPVHPIVVTAFAAQGLAAAAIAGQEYRERDMLRDSSSASPNRVRSETSLTA